ncbi:hypothetical protein O3M35_011034 [Rhynocoris fuscipes]|uniref:TLC domain-containing protein n=1 Tax=Rhynocoris fuscipes TaxID=488301 RepID=A0AAW1CUV9_9HEMI
MEDTYKIFKGLNEADINLLLHSFFTIIAFASGWFLFYLLVLKAFGIPDNNAQKVTSYLNSVAICQSITVNIFGNRLDNNNMLITNNKNAGYELLILNAYMGYLLYSTAFWKFIRKEIPVHIAVLYFATIFGCCITKGIGAHLVLKYLYLLEICTLAHIPVFLLDYVAKQNRNQYLYLFNAFIRFLLIIHLCYHRFYLGLKFAYRISMSPSLPLYLHTIFPIMVLISIFHLSLIVMKINKDYKWYNHVRKLPTVSISSLFK